MLGFLFLQEGDSVELQIVRSRGTLVRQFLRYTVEPRDNNEFYGSTGILEFKPGEREIIITLLTRMDGIPEVEMKIFHSSNCVHSITVCHLLKYRKINRSRTSMQCFSTECIPSLQIRDAWITRRYLWL